MIYWVLKSMLLGIDLIYLFPKTFNLQVFVAGSTGRVGLRIVRQLLLAGFKVRAGARNTEKAQQYSKLAEDFGIVGSDALKRLQIVQVDLEDTSTIINAIGPAAKVKSQNYIYQV